jgi:hypothetical protein
MCVWLHVFLCCRIMSEAFCACAARVVMTQQHMYSMLPSDCPAVCASNWAETTTSPTSLSKACHFRCHHFFNFFSFLNCQPPAAVISACAHRSMVQLRAYLERVRPIDRQLSYQIDKLLRATAAAATTAPGGAAAGGAAAPDGGGGGDAPPHTNGAGGGSGEDVLRYRPNPSALLGDTAGGTAAHCCSCCCCCCYC